MHNLMLMEVVKACRQRQKEGDRPVTPPFSREILEDTVVQLADREGTAKDQAERIESLLQLIRSFDAAIRMVAAELTGQACGGVDPVDNINPETGKPYGQGGHTGWLLAKEAARLKTELAEAEERAEIVLAEFTATDIITYKKQFEQAEALLRERDVRIAGMEKALKKIEERDRHSMFERCPDCYSDKLGCSREAGCKQSKYSDIGKWAIKALASAPESGITELIEASVAKLYANEHGTEDEANQAGLRWDEAVRNLGGKP